MVGCVYLCTIHVCGVLLRRKIHDQGLIYRKYALTKMGYACLYEILSVCVMCCEDEERMKKYSSVGYVCSQRWNIPMSMCDMYMCV